MKHGKVVHRLSLKFTYGGPIMEQESLLFTKDHEWVSIDDDVATIGISHHAVNELGDVVFVELPAVGDSFEMSDEFGTVESVKTVSSLYSPISGTVTEVNTNLENEPNLVTDSNYDQGWIIKIKPNNLDDTHHLMSYNDYQESLTTD